jgi:hypothetical protein
MSARSGKADANRRLLKHERELKRRERREVKAEAQRLRRIGKRRA